MIVRLPARLADPAQAWPRPRPRPAPGPGRLLRRARCLVSRGGLGGRCGGGAISGSAGAREAGARWAQRAELADCERSPDRPDGESGPADAGALPWPACSTPRSATHWSRSDRRNRVSRPAWRSRPCSSGPARPWPPRSRPTCWPRRSTRRRALGPVFVFDPFALAGTSPSPGRRCPAARDLGRRAGGRLAAGRRGELDSRGVEGGDFWAVAAEQRLAPLLFTAALAGLGMDAVVRVGLRPGDPRARRDDRPADRPGRQRRAVRGCSCRLRRSPGL